jgi:hypothetical protein
MQDGTLGACETFHSLRLQTARKLREIGLSNPIASEGTSSCHCAVSSMPFPGLADRDQVQSDGKNYEDAGRDRIFLSPLHSACKSAERPTKGGGESTSTSKGVGSCWMQTRGNR